MPTPKTAKRKRTTRTVASKRAKRVLTAISRAVKPKTSAKKRFASRPKVSKKLRKQITDVVHHSDKHHVWFPITNRSLEQRNGSTAGCMPIQTAVPSAVDNGCPANRLLVPCLTRRGRDNAPSLFTRTGDKVYPKSLTLYGHLDLTDRFSFNDQFNWHTGTFPASVSGFLDRMSVTVKIFVFDWEKSKLPEYPLEPEREMRWQEILNYADGATPQDARFTETEWDPALAYQRMLGKMDPGGHFKILAKKTLKWKMAGNYNVGGNATTAAYGITNMHMARQSRRSFRIRIPVPKVLHYPESSDKIPANFKPMAFAMMTYDNGASSPTVPGFWLSLQDMSVDFKYSP